MAKKKAKKKSARSAATPSTRRGHCPCCGKLLPLGMSAKEIARLYRKGLSTREISAVAGINQATVHERLRQQKVKMRPVGAPRRS